MKRLVENDTLSDSGAGPSSVFRDDRAHVFRSWSAQRNLSPMVVKGGSGCWFWDEANHKYLDFCSQRVNLSLGHQHPKMVKALVEQIQTLATIGPLNATKVRSDAAAAIARHTPGLNKIFFTNCGTDAVEHAVRMARAHTGRPKALAMYRSYHGSSLLGLSLTGDPRRWAIEPGAPGVVHFFGPYLYRSAFGASTEEEEGQRALAHLSEVLRYEGPDTVAAILLESIVGSNGVLKPPPGYLEGVRRICDQHGIVMICDEVMSGFGRAGAWFAVDLWGVAPDLITFAKGVNSGYVPLGGVAISDAVAETFQDRVFFGGGTYYGHPLACASAAASIAIYEEDGLVERAKRLGEEILGPGLAALAEKHPCVGDVRGVGAFWALELVKDKRTREMLVPFNAHGQDAAPARELAQACLQRGLYGLFVDNRVLVAPPLIVSDEEARLGLSLLDEALTTVDRHASA